MSVAVDRSTVDTLQAALTCHRERHTVVAGNIPNLDTPGYRPVDLERRIAGDPAELAVTHEGHTAAPATTDAVTSFDDGGALQGGDGNAVSLERELSKIDASCARCDRGRAGLAPARGAAPRRRRRHLMSAMDWFTAMEVSASGLPAERTGMDVAASHLANAETTQAAGGGPYRRRNVVLQSVDVPGVTGTPLAEEMPR